MKFQLGSRLSQVALFLCLSEIDWNLTTGALLAGSLFHVVLGFPVAIFVSRAEEEGRE